MKVWWWFLDLIDDLIFAFSESPMVRNRKWCERKNADKDKEDRG